MLAAYAPMTAEDSKRALEAFANDGWLDMVHSNRRHNEIFQAYIRPAPFILLHYVNQAQLHPCA